MSTSTSGDQTPEKKLLYNELFKHPSDEFKRHLELNDNNRILFSGMYGVGKTTFLDHFFNSETQKNNFETEKFKVIHLYPVNYSISTTEDIFKYIKIDILYELLTNYKDDIEFDHSKLSTSTIASFYLASKFNKVAEPLLMMLGHLNTSTFPAEQILSACSTLKDLADKICTEIDQKKEDSDNLKQVAKFLKPEMEREGSPYEQNLVTNLIIDFTNQLRKDGKETILIIDDLDRLDPSHIFRLFNIFAAHFDQKQEAHNKFGFNKVIFVCDVDNIKRLYAHFYGGDSSFSGYIDKFYSRRIFRYDNLNSLAEMVKELVKSSKMYYEYYNQTHRFHNDLVNHNLVNILKIFLINGSVNLRSLMKVSRSIVLSYKDLELGLPYDNMNIHIPAAVELEVLTNILGGKDEVLDAFELAKKNSNLAPESSLKIPAYRNFAASCLPVIGDGEDQYRSYAIQNDEYLQIELKPNNNYGPVSVVSADGSYVQSANTTLDIDAADFYIIAMKKLIKQRFLQ